jgi:hypothetical protein
MRLIGGAWWRKSLAAKFRFQGCCSRRANRAYSNGVRGPNLDPSAGSDWIDQRVGEDKPASVDSWLRRWRLESKRAPLIRPCDRQIDETLEANAARQASIDYRLDDVRRKKSERQSHSDRTHSPAHP